MHTPRRHRLAAGALGAVVLCCILLRGTDSGWALPQIPARPIAYVLHWEGGPPGLWATPLLNERADTQDLQRLEAILRSASVVPGVTWNRSRGGLSVQIPDPVMSYGYTVAWSGGPRLNVTNTVVACRSTTCGPAPGYAQVNGVVVYAPGLLPLLHTLAHRMRLVDSLVATPSAQAAGGPLTIAGQGWIGPTVRLMLSWGVGMARSRVLGNVAVRAGAFRWTGAVPDLAPGPYGLSADDGARSVAWLNLQVT